MQAMVLLTSTPGVGTVGLADMLRLSFLRALGIHARLDIRTQAKPNTAFHTY